jgi:hypothetical protein
MHGSGAHVRWRTTAASEPASPRTNCARAPLGSRRSTAPSTAGMVRLRAGLRIELDHTEIHT